MSRRVLLLLVLLAILPCRALAAAAEDFAKAEKLYFTAITSMGAYQGRIGNMAFSALEQDGWVMRPFKKSDADSEIKFFMMKIDRADGYPDYLMAIAGTESGKDISTDLRWGKVPYGGNTLAEFAAYSKRKDLTGDVPKVHEGFNQYVQLLLSLSEDDSKDAAVVKQDKQRTVLERLREDPGTEILLVGHSLGGAAATLLASRLIDLGVAPEKIEVVTFGAPSVGNNTFAELEREKLNLKRYINRGDPVPYGLSTIVGGYAQFGHEEHWDVPKTVNSHPHAMATYLDYAMKDYYDKRKVLETETQEKINRKGLHKTSLEVNGYMLPLRNELPSELNEEFPYMQEVMSDQAWRTFPDAVIAEKEMSLTEHLKIANERGCAVVLAPTVSAKRIKDEGRRYYVQLRLFVYNAADGSLIGGYVYSSNTREFTPLEAFLSDVRNMTAESGEWMKALPKPGDDKGKSFNVRVE